MSEPVSELTTEQRKRRWQIAGYVVGVLFFAAAIFVVATQGSVLADAMKSVSGAPPWLIACTIFLPLLNWIVVSISLWILTNAYGRVALGEMHALIANAWLLNYLPMRPGMAGRITYHKLVNRIRVRDSAKVVMQATAATGVSFLILGGIAAGLADRVGPLVWTLTLSAPCLLFGLAPLFLTSRPFWQRYSIVLLLRHVDMLIWVARYWVVFALIDIQLGLAGAVVFAVVSQIALLLPFTGNGLGVREWFIGQTAVLGVVAGLDQQAVGLTADLINRAGELVASVPIGLASMWWVSRRLTRLGESPSETPAEHQPEPA